MWLTQQNAGCRMTIGRRRIYRFFQPMGACRHLLLSVSLSWVLGCGAATKEPVRIFAAISTREALEQIATDFRAQTGTMVELNLGPSSDLARQIEYGAGADLYLSADEKWADYLAQKGHVEKRRDLLANELVVVVPEESTFKIHDLADLADEVVHRVAVAAPAVPAGRYARVALQKAGVWDRVKARTLDGGDVRAALAYVARGEAEAGLVYATDALGNPKVRVGLKVNPELHAPIRYPLALIRRDPLKSDAGRLYDYLGSEHAAEIFRAKGFGVVVAKGY